MRTQIIIILLFSFQGLIAQDLKNYDGWEFLPWKAKKFQVEQKIKDQGNKIEKGIALDADFIFNKMNTWLEYNQNDELIKITQRETFSVIQDKKAALFFDTCKKELIEKYGKPTHTESNKKESIIHMDWELTYTSIQLTYDYKYKIIDEFGAGSYWVEIIYKPIKN